MLSLIERFLSRRTLQEHETVLTFARDSEEFYKVASTMYENFLYIVHKKVKYLAKIRFYTFLYVSGQIRPMLRHFKIFDSLWFTTRKKTLIFE